MKKITIKVDDYTYSWLIKLWADINPDIDFSVFVGCLINSVMANSK